MQSPENPRSFKKILFALLLFGTLAALLFCLAVGLTALARPARAILCAFLDAGVDVLCAVLTLPRWALRLLRRIFAAF